MVNPKRLKPNACFLRQFPLRPYPMVVPKEEGEEEDYDEVVFSFQWAVCQCSVGSFQWAVSVGSGQFSVGSGQCSVCSVQGNSGSYQFWLDIVKGFALSFRT